MTTLAPVEDAHQPDAGLIEQLEALLESARDGELQGMAYATLLSKRQFGTGTAGRFRVLDMIGALRVLERELVDGSVDLVNKPAGEPYL